MTSVFVQAAFSDLSGDKPEVQVEDDGTMNLGENGCPQFTDKGLGDDVLALSNYVRGVDTTNINCTMNRVHDSNNVFDTVRLFLLMFVTRNCRGGKGEKKLSYDMFFNLYSRYPDTTLKMLEFFPHYGYYKDLLLIADQAKKILTKQESDKVINKMLDIYAKDFKNDVAELERAKQAGETPKLTLVAKYMPRQGKKFDESDGLNFVSRFILFVNSDMVATTKEEVQTPQIVRSKWNNAKKWYRKNVTELTQYLALPEVYLSTQKADEINFARMASKATLRLMKALLNKKLKSSDIRYPDDARRILCAELFTKHLKTKGLHGAQLQPHEIVKKILAGKYISEEERIGLNAQWESLRQSVLDQVGQEKEFNLEKMVALSDVSSSMSGDPMYVSIAMGILVSEICHPSFRNLVMTFETQPRWHNLSDCTDIVDKVNSLAKAPWGGSTNFEAAIDLVLNVCVSNKLKHEDMPTLIVFSDMQFDEAGQTSYYSRKPANKTTMFDSIKLKVSNVAHQLGWTNSDPPVIVFWNLRNCGGHPVQKDTQGTVMLSGFSSSLLKMVMNGEALVEEEKDVVQEDGTIKKEKVRVSPQQVLQKMLDDSAYDPIRVVLSQSNEGLFSNYSFGPGMEMFDDDEEVLVSFKDLSTSSA